ncbi:MAG: MFS transporter [Oscillospiraceae bacterium]|jgi:predicted MFS family arabinose efflux permease|nr:MFS transporter [Oscillospiraceae bacterium]
MIKIFKPLWTKICGLLIIICAAGFTLWNFDFFYFYPFLNSRKYTVEDSISIAINSNDEMVIIDSSGSKIISVNKNNEITFLKLGKTSPIEDFNSASDVCCDKNGNIYIHDVKRAEGNKVDSESILKFSSNGFFLKKIFNANYKDKLKNSEVIKIFTIDNEFYYVTADSIGFYIKNLENEIIKKINYENAKLNTLKCDIQSLDEITVLTKSGEFIKVSENNSFLIYNRSRETNSIPIYFKVLSDNRIVYSDINDRRIYIFDPMEYQNGSEDAANLVIIDKSSEDINECPLYYKFFVEENKSDLPRIIAPSSEVILDFNSEEENYYDTFKYSKKLIINYILFCISVLIIFIIFIFLIIFISKKIIKSKSFVVKVCSLVFIGTVFLTVIFCAISFENFNKRMTDELVKKAQVATAIVQENIPYDEFEGINKNSHFMNEDYKKLRSAIKGIFSKKNDFIDNFYCTVQKITKEDSIPESVYNTDNCVVSAVFDTNETYAGIYPLFPYTEENVEYEILTSQKPMTFTSISTQEGTFIFVLSPLINSSGKSVGLVEIGTSLDAFEAENSKFMISLFLGIASIAILLILLVLEISIFMNSKKEAGRLAAKKEKIKMNAPMSRMFAFIIYVSINMVSGFAPLYSISIAPQIGNFSKEFMASMPFIAETFFGMIVLFLGNKFINFLGKRKCAIICGMLFAAGLTLKALIPNFWILMLGGIISAIGKSILLLMINNLLIAEDSSDAYAGYNSSVLNGATCGIITGSFLLNWLSYIQIYIISAFFSLSVIYFIFLYIHDAKQKEEQHENAKDELSGIFKFIFSKKVFIYFLASFIPIIICASYTDYMLPFEGEKLGLNDSYIGYLYTVGSLCSIALGNFMTNLVSSKMKDSVAILLGTCLTSFSFFLFAKFQTIPMLIISILIFGISNSFLYSIQSKYYASLESVKKYGGSSAIGSVVESVGYILGPIVFSFIITNQTSKNLTLLCVAVLILSLIFFLFSWNKHKIKART